MTTSSQGPLETPAAPYLGIYRLNMVRPDAPIVVLRESNLEVVLSPGGFAFQVSAPETVFAPPSVTVTLGVRTIRVPPGSYMVVTSLIDSPNDRDNEMASALVVGEAVALLQLRLGAVEERVFEGYVNPPNGFIMIPEGGAMSISALPATPPQDVAVQLAADVQLARNLSVEQRDRFRLAARWLVRAETTRHPVDRFLMFWTVLEIFPMAGTTDIRPISDLLAANVVPHLSPSDVKAKLGIGRMFGMRSDIVHNGKAFVGNAEQVAFEELLAKLGAVADACLRVLAGLPTSGVFDRWIPPLP